MPQFDEKHIKICGCTIVWDGVTRPEHDAASGKSKYTLKVVIEPNNPDLALFTQLGQTTLQQSKFQGVLPAGGLMPVGVALPTEFLGMFNGYGVVSAKSWFAPDVYDEAGALLDPMQYAPLIYGGQKVDILVHCYDYDKAGNRGISAGLDAFSIIASAQAQRYEFGSRMQTAGAFTGQPGQPGYVAPIVAGSNATGQPGPVAAFDPVTGLPIVVNPAYPAAGSFDPVTGLPIAVNPAPAQRFDPATGLPIAPAQATNFMPPA